METRVARKFTYGQDRAEVKVYNRPVGGFPNRKKECIYWLAGKCNRNPCHFSHGERPPKLTYNRNLVQTRTSPENSILNGSSKPSPNVTLDSMIKDDGPGAKITQNSQENVDPRNNDKVCEYWVSSNCVYGDKCRYLHSWFRGDGFTRLTQLEGHKKAITGIALPLGSNKLYSASGDGTVRVWDCNTGECGNVINLGCAVGSLITEGPWVFVGMPYAIKAWNIQTCVEHTLTGPVGQVYSMIVGNDTLFAGVRNGDILAWKAGSETNPFHLTASLKGHSLSVVSLAVGGNMLYSGSVDLTIKVWDIDSLQCVQTLNGHSEAVMSLLCWDQFLLSASLDGTIKVWAVTESENLEVTYTHNEDHGVLALCGIHDSEAKPILLCSCNDNSVRLYELPSFSERGRLFAKKEVREILIWPSGLFFTGDGNGQLGVWKMIAEPSAEASKNV